MGRLNWIWRALWTLNAIRAPLPHRPWSLLITDADNVIHNTPIPYFRPSALAGAGCVG